MRIIVPITAVHFCCFDLLIDRSGKGGPDQDQSNSGLKTLRQETIAGDICELKHASIVVR